MANVSIGGNVTDSVIVCGNDNYVINIGDVNGGVVNIIKPSDKPKYSARPMPVTIKPRAFPSLLDRESEFEAIKKASQLSFPVSVWGQQGIGKTSFIRHLAHTLDAGTFTSGLAYLNAANLGYEDLLQALFDTFFDSDSSYKPNTAEILHALQSIKALIFLDDLQIGRDEAASILDAAPRSLFVLSSTERSLWGEGEVVPLRGLPEGESLNLFEKELSRPLNEQEKQTILKICSMLQGHPLQILQAAALARESGSSMENLLIKIENEKTENKSMAYISMASLSDSEKQVLAVLAAAGGNIVPLKHLKGIFKEGYEQNDIQRLITLGLVQSHSPRFSVTDALVSSLSSAWDITSWQDVLLNYAINWLSQQPVSALVEESSGLLIHTIKNAGERKKWREVIQLGRLLEKFMVFYKRWQTWSDILNLILTAAKALNDSKMQAWALHQLGSRALYLGYANEARTFLSQALNLRQTIGDKAGQAITQHNINTLNGIITPLKRNSSGCRRILTYGIGAIIGLGALAVIVPALIYFLANYHFSVTPPTESPAEPATIYQTDIPVPSTPISTNTVTPPNTPSLTPTLTITATPTHTPTPSITLTPTSSIPQIEFKQNANCRFGPGTKYETVTTFSQGQTVEIVGRNDTDPRWWLVLIPGYSNWQCWVSDVTGITSGPISDARVVEAPLLPPSAPTGFLVSTDDSCNVILSWNDVSGEDGYRVYRNGTLIAELPENTTSYQDSGYDSQSYYVQAYNSAGSANSINVTSEYCG